ncbi:ABC transporter permease [Helicobacter sp. 11S03491-1]|uniref:ABC transporter permease n=1 Tax=Helicobacter sp. 11S03491-1 TaxID=1476196 RepID=UPI000BA73476|nr:ABC transporter permease [Helicobacter sp. 11S03491-1]PAF41228.1 ABC transporter permease [Helicobacter sp. 11S03491-1]
MSFLKILYQEFRAIFSNIAVIFVVIVGSILYGFLYPSAYKNDVVVSQKIAVVDMDNTSLSKELIFLIQATPQVDVEEVTFSVKQAKELLEHGIVYGILEIPQNFQANIHKKIPTKLVYSANASYFLIYGAIVDGIYRAIEEISSRIKLKRVFLQGGVKNESTDLIMHHSIPLFNPSVGYINYALAAILIFILHQTLIAGAGILGASQNEKNSQGIYGYWNEAGALKLVLARISAFFMIYILLFLLYFGVLFQLYGIHIQANAISFWCFGIMFILCCASFGVLFGLLVKNPVLPTQIVLISSLPLVFMMGFIWPVELLPDWVVWFVRFIPAFSGINGLVRINQMGADLVLVMEYFYWLLGLFISSLVISVFVISLKRKTWIKKEKFYSP